MVNDDWGPKRDCRLLTEFGPVGAALAAAMLTAIFTGVVRWLALSRSILDHPNERSAHTAPTPRGGGLAVVVVVASWLTLAGFAGIAEWKFVAGVGGGSVAVAAIGWLDDLRSLSANVRLACHFLAATWTVWCLGGMPSLSLGYTNAHLGIAGAVLAVVGLVWMTNLFNFMDGIDGIAGVEALSIGAFGGGLLLVSGAPVLATLSLVTAGAAFGFLLWNWSPARIFLGDVGSGFLGFVFGSLAIASENAQRLPVMIWAILAAAFIVDATITFGRRLRRGYWRHAHRTHAYQRAVQSGRSHAIVSGGVAGLNVLLGAIAIVTFQGHVPLLLGVTLAFALVIAVYMVVEKAKPFTLE